MTDIEIKVLHQVVTFPGEEDALELGYGIRRQMDKYGYEELEAISVVFRERHRHGRSFLSMTSCVRQAQVLRQCCGT